MKNTKKRPAPSPETLEAARIYLRNRCAYLAGFSTTFAASIILVPNAHGAWTIRDVFILIIRVILGYATFVSAVFTNAMNTALTQAKKIYLSAPRSAREQLAEQEHSRRLQINRFLKRRIPSVAHARRTGTHKFTS